MLTVRAVWRGALPPGTELLAGGAGLERRVEWATQLRSRPPAFDALKGGELAVIPVRSLRLLDDRLDLATVMRSLAEKGGVAVVVIGDASAEAIAVADQMIMPLLRLPADVAPAEVLHGAVRFILDQRTQLTEREQELRHQLLELAMAGAGIPAITDRLAELVESGAVWLEADGTVAHASPGAADAGWLEAEHPAIERWLAMEPLSAANPPVRELARDGNRALLAPIVLRDRVAGFVALVGPSGIGTLSHIGVSRAASAAAIELDRTRAMLDVRDDLEGDFVASLLRASYSSEAAIADRAGRLGIDLSGNNAVIVVGGGADPDSLLPAARRLLAARAGGGVAGILDGRLCVVLPSAVEGPELQRLATAVLDGAGHPVGGSPAAGAGIGGVRPGIAGISRSCHEAERALVMGRRLHGAGHAVSYRRLGLHRLLAAIADQPELTEFVSERLQPLRDRDRRGDLLVTLDAFFACHGSPTEMAQHLNLHRNTVLYRLRRIEDIGGIDLSDPQTRLELQLSLRAAEVLALR